MTIFVCPVGTSIVAGPLIGEAETEQDFRSWIEERIQREWNGRQSDENFLIRLTAETNGLHRMGCGKGDTVYLLASDTTAGRVCAEKLASVIESRMGATAHTRTVSGLKVTDGEAFRKTGVRSLFNELNRIRLDHKGDEIRINATGGFKGTLPFVVLYAMNHGFECAYVFDQSETLIQLPRLPMRIDLSRLGRMVPLVMGLADVTFVTKREWHNRLPPVYWENQQDFDILFEEDEGYVTLSPVGLLVADGIKVAGERTKILLSPSASATLYKAPPVDKDAYLDILARLRNPVHRGTFRHNAPLRELDLRVWKAGRNTPAARSVVYWQDGDDIRVAELFPTHETYDNFWSDPANHRTKYFDQEFVEHVDDAEPEYDILSDIDADRDAWEKERAELERARKELEAFREEMEREIKRRVEQATNQEKQRLDKREHELDQRHAKISNSLINQKKENSDKPKKRRRNRKKAKLGPSPHAEQPVNLQGS